MIIYNKLYKSYKSYFFKKEEIIVKTPKGKFAWTATVGEKGQIVIPKKARDVFNIKPGDTLLLLGDEKRGIAIPPKGAFAHLMEIAFEDKKTSYQMSIQNKK